MSQPQEEIIADSWEVFDDCPTCGVGTGDACCNLARSTSKRLVRTFRAHRERKILKEIPRTSLQ